MKQPKVIFLDAVGTLFGVRTTVGQIYADLAQRYGIEVSSDILEREFIQAFSDSPPLVFPGINSQEIPEQEFNWWLTIAQRVFQQAGVFDKFIDFRDFFEELYIYFASDEPWIVYPEVKTTLHNWQQQGVQLGIISNFDSRLYFVLPALGLDKYFQSVTISSQAGAAKPSQEIFLQALKKHNCQPQEACHIGDSRKEDFEGATAVGLKGVLIQRSL
ncbi:HAD-IA family hydrolase [Merismopedia glauca]|uniref:Hydrolase n=1 Tax=Merismopedia glauca CCAP 1448/3 TaxID=1296344 RepID=A0A2T1C7G7_9CYAN|nr:HAD-IA family hydrolase [Merismopedia glauca]PSB04210.1 hydrolase [Merismopedia glauca CCAP 1448/3]